MDYQDLLVDLQKYLKISNNILYYDKVKRKIHPL
jgi:hypothetical protein